MAKRQNFIVGSTNSVTETLTDAQLDAAFDRYEILTADKLDGVFNAVSDYSSDSSNEIANAIQSITGSQPTGTSQTELAGALQQMRSEIETTSLTFKGYVSTSAPSSSDYTLIEGNIWINSATMPTSFPIAASSIKEWDGSAWVNYGETYTPADFDFFRNINDNEGYYWFGGLWTVMSTDMSTTYFTLNQSTGKWEIKSNVNLPGAPTTTTPDSSDKSTKIATTQYVHDTAENYVSNCITEIPQDINLTLSSGTLTLKAGSKVYVPNGSGVFDVVTINADVSATRTDNQDCVVFYTPSVNTLSVIPVILAYSGTTAPTASTFMYWYDTTNNKCKFTNDTGTTWYDGRSLILGIVSTDGTQISAIKHVFNGFGYVGSTVFMLPNVMGLVPSGRNTDGTLKTTLVKPSTVITRTGMGTSVSDYEVGLNSGYFFNYSSNYTLGDDGFLHIPNGTVYNDVVFATYSTGADGRITKFDSKPVFHAADYYDLKNVSLDVDTKISEMLKALYPVGSIYIGTQSTCPLETLIPGSVWAAVTGHYLLASGTLAGTTETYVARNTVESGAPNITAQIKTSGTNQSGSGAVTYTQVSTGARGWDGTGAANGQWDLNASSSSSVYGKSAAIRAPAYVVNVWRRNS